MSFRNDAPVGPAAGESREVVCKRAQAAAHYMNGAVCRAAASAVIGKGIDHPRPAAVSPFGGVQPFVMVVVAADDKINTMVVDDAYQAAGVEHVINDLKARF